MDDETVTESQSVATRSLDGKNHTRIAFDVAQLLMKTQMANHDLVAFDTGPDHRQLRAAVEVGGHEMAVGPRHQKIDCGRGVVEQPVSGRQSGRETRYRIADPYLAFWTRFIEPALPLLDRGRSQQVLQSILGQWPDYRGRAIEPIVRDSVARLLPIDGVDAHTVASYWTRDGRSEVDLVGIDGDRTKRRVSFIGSIKWRQRRPFSGADASALAAQLHLVPGVDDRTVLLAVSSSGFDVRDFPITLGPAELLRAWSS